MSLDITIIIVNYNTAKLVKSCIDLVLQQKNINFEIIVVDNASKDDSIKILKSYQNQITLIANSQNVGFGKANNQAFSKSHGRYIFLLNPDATLETDHDLHHLVNLMDNNPKYGLVGPRVIKNNRDTHPRKYYPGQKYVKTDFSHLPGKIAWVIGACMIIRREVYDIVSGFDEDYFLYAEETDLCLRIRKQGFQIGYCDEVIIKHIGGVSEKNTATSQLWQKKQMGIHLFYKKNYSLANAIKLVKRDMAIAKRRLLIMKLKNLFTTLNQNDLSKMSRYQTIYEASKKFLAS